MKNEDRIVELLAESLQRQDRMVEQLSNLDNRMGRVEQGLEKLTQAVTSLATGFNEFVEIHRATTKQQSDRLSVIERRLDDLERRVS
jgi:conjugal transfer/entry exclusion protein